MFPLPQTATPKADSDKNDKLVQTQSGFYIAANVALLASGTVGSTWSQTIGGGANLAASITLFIAKNNPVSYAAAQTACLFGGICTNLNGVAQGDPLVLIGTGLLTAGLTFGAFSSKWAQKWGVQKKGGARRRFVSITMGKPRTMMGTLLMLSKPFLGWDAWVRKDYGYLTVLGIFGIGDIVGAFSHPRRPTNPPGQVAAKPKSSL